MHIAPLHHTVNLLSICCQFAVNLLSICCQCAVNLLSICCQFAVNELSMKKTQPHNAAFCGNKECIYMYVHIYYIYFLHSPPGAGKK